MRPWVSPIALMVSVAFPAVAAPQQAATAEKVIEIDTLDVRDTLYHLSGGGGNAMALIDEINGGVVLIDTKLEGWGEAVMEMVAAVTHLSVTTIINTHAGEDHAGANAEFPEVSQIVAHENTRAHMTRMAAYSGERASGLPTSTVTEHFSLLEDLDRIELYYFGPAHTDGDLVVVFPQKRVAYLGELFPDKRTPVIDTARGGSGVSFPATLLKVVAAIDNVDRVITGHGPFPTTYAGRGRRERGAARPWSGWMTWTDLAEYADFNQAFLTAVQAAHREGLSAEQAASSLAMPERFEEYGMEHARANVGAIYEELAAR
ncbi:MAG: MBL fold metallo-hydrolase [Acidobacteriota bacterium]|nr:MBL fold metallo-hydrolase [Acidobacteriota bacterium]